MIKLTKSDEEELRERCGFSEFGEAVLSYIKDLEEKSLHFECPFTGLKFKFHNQNQVDMLQKHFEFLKSTYVRKGE